MAATTIAGAGAGTTIETIIMTKIQSYFFLPVGLGALCTSCTLTKERTFEQVLQRRCYTGSKLHGDYYTFYCGSDEKYHYYSCISCFPAQLFGVTDGRGSPCVSTGATRRN